MKFDWVSFEGYDETHQLVDERGRIVGEVSGSRFCQERGWAAFHDMGISTVALGRYVSVGQAKDAVTLAVKELVGKGAVA